MRTTLALIPLLAAPVLAQWKAEARTAPGPRAPEGQILEWTSPQGKPFLYRMPMKRGGAAPALILMLHGTGMTYPWAFGNYQVVASRFRPNDILVAPEGMTPGAGDTFNFLQGEADGDQIADLIRLFRKSCEVGSVYLYGHSQGAFFCYWFAGRHPELVDGIVAHAGNVLQVKHSKLAKKKVAIGILHGRADAVVSVDCAFRTEKIYREQGYEKVRLYVVEGLNEQTGHWPLPVQLREMLDWLDRVSVASPEVLLDQAEAQLAAKAPALGVVVEAVVRARDLLKRASKEEKAAAEARLRPLESRLEALAAAHAKALEEAQAALKGTPEFAPWIGHFHAVDDAFGDLDAWSRPMKKLRSQARRDSRTVAKALSGLERSGARGLRAALKAVEDAVLGARYDELLAALERSLTPRPRGLSEERAREIAALVAARREGLAQGRAAAAALTLSALGSASEGGG